MANQSVVFGFTRVPNFMDDYNIEFLVDDMDGSTKNYAFVIATSCPANIDDCLDPDDGTLNNDVVKYNIGDDGDVALLYSKGVNGNRTISLGASDVTINVGDNDIMLAGLFLVSKASGYVLAYSILARSVPITNQVIFPATGLVWSIRNEG